jgi:site-specific recombinase XerD
MKNETHIEKFRDFLRGEKRSEATIDTYTRGVKQFLSAIGKDVDRITDTDIRNYKIYMTTEKKYGNNTLITKYASVKTFYEYLNKSLDRKILKSPKKKIVNKIPLTENDILKLFEVSRHNKRDNCILQTLYYSGLRKSELVSLDTDCIDMEKMVIYVYSGKGNKDATINLHEEAINSIKDYLEVRHPKNPNDKALFLNENGYRLSGGLIQHIVKKYASIAGIEKRTYPHLFRISLATHMSERGCSLEEVRLQTRHTDYKTLRGYIQLSPEHTRKAYLKGISLIKQQNPKPDTTIPKHKTPTPKPEIQDNTDKYIQLLKDGLIDKADFLKLISANKMETNDYIY